MQTIHIRFMQGKDVTLSISSQHTIAQIKRQLLSQLHQENKVARLVYRGQLLKEDHWTLSDYNILSSQPIYIHCVLSEPCHHEITANNTPSMTYCNNRGFDKLREFGYNEEEIRSIRSRFHPSHSTLDYVDEESLTIQHLEREEEWLETTGNRIPEEGTVKEMFCGLLLGFFLGVLNLFWFKETVFTRRHQMGILAGMLINVYYGITHVIH